MIKKITIIFLTAIVLWAQDCDTKLFSLKAMSDNGRGITINSVLKDIAATCNISIIFEDPKARIKVHKSLDYVNIKDYTLEELFDFILGENNLFYNYNPRKHILKVAYYKTKNFNIDYINLSSLTSESKKMVILGTTSGSDTYGSGGIGSGNGSGGTTGTTGNEESSAYTNDYTTITTKSQFTFWQSLHKQLETLLIGVSGRRDFKIFINQDASLVTVTGTKKELEAVKRFLDKLADRMHKQVLIEAKIIEVKYKDEQTLGIDWSKFNLTLTGSREGYKTRADGVSVSNLAHPNYFIGYNFSMQGLFDFLKKYGDVKVLSNPKILTLNNQPAIINVGDQLSYRYETSGTTNIQSGSTVGTQTYAIGQSFIGVTLYVIPEITDNNQIIMKVNPVSSELIHADENNQSMRVLPPDVKIKQLTSIVKVRDGQKILIGGLVSKNYNNDHTKVPLLGDVPIIGRIFHSTKRVQKRSELFILLVPKIIKEHNVPTIDDVAIFKDDDG
ncbi:type II secretion system protein GspD [Nitratiruptor sp. YY09-18]|uniref:type II secretion system protein GspD n=1 Tax=Nitratiruptor sp. YY09-18 TaxID=2724901 RepID=UPI0019168BBE|nr:secretin N-terminal domain-containing protein [Nitratiruptor sp. YY09-18]BCD68672.1 general secretion pathway protein D [Nitratiruptor sp. YY09-18]